MKKIILSIFFCVICFNSYSQQFQTDYVRGKNSTFCGEENYKFNFEDRMFTKKDSYSGDESYGPSKVTQTNYDDNGYYFEIRTPKFILEERGIDEYRKYYHFSHKVLYDKRGGNVLYVYEIDNDSNSDNGKFYFTKKGYELFCK